ncbi:hypothetical protein JX265_000093 [Neoarthrinium moseri]|uniref:Methyltransferase domain-containing protein n=1 Tax=Neoarthrinium moseri TaxID=1658444 RepID=A0A9Q0AVX7_9PEZI|nr:hypothetical protein JX266_008093 [Neoarthrinium moseri]KAI1881267.1 hypothetical protein JX265_000093 [Neoarthrinium moseri]
MRPSNTIADITTEYPETAGHTLSPLTRLVHDIFHLKFGEQLILPERRMNALRRVLDCGSGNCSWALDVARQYPNCEVHGVDISPIMMPFGLPSNLFLYQCDLNDEIPYPDNHFDFVHSRLVDGGVNSDRWVPYIREMKRVLVRRGWVQMVEIYFNAQSFNGSFNDLPDGGALRQWSSHYLGAMRRLGKNPAIGMRLGDMLTASGFVEVEAQSFNLPMCAWSNESQLAAYNQYNVAELLHSLALWPLTARPGGLRMTIDEFDRLVGNARVEASNPNLKTVVVGSHISKWMSYVAVGRLVACQDLEDGDSKPLAPSVGSGSLFKVYAELGSKLESAILSYLGVLGSSQLGPVHSTTPAMS